MAAAVQEPPTLEAPPDAKRVQVEATPAPPVVTPETPAMVPAAAVLPAVATPQAPMGAVLPVVAPPAVAQAPVPQFGAAQVAPPAFPTCKCGHPMRAGKKKDTGRMYQACGARTFNPQTREYEGGCGQFDWLSPDPVTLHINALTMRVQQLEAKAGIPSPPFTPLK